MVVRGEERLSETRWLQFYIFYINA